MAKIPLDATLDDVLGALTKQYGEEKVKLVQMRYMRQGTESMFKGTAYVECDSVETAKAIVEGESNTKMRLSRK